MSLRDEGVWVDPMLEALTARRVLVLQRILGIGLGERPYPLLMNVPVFIYIVYALRNIGRRVFLRRTE